MRKIIIVFLLNGLMIPYNSFGMLTKTLPIKHIKKIRSFHTSRPLQDIFSIWASMDAEKANKNTQAILDKANTNNELLHKIIQQNEQNNNLLKENNLLLRTIVKQNYLYASLKRSLANKKEFETSYYGRYYPHKKGHRDLLEHYDTLKKQYEIDITYQLE
jgi:hypothetical protein